MGTLSELPSVHNHRLNHNPSKLPSYRVSDLLSGPLQTPVRTEHEPAPPAPPVFEPAHNNNPPNEHQQVTVQQQQQQPQNKHARNQSDSATTSPSQSSLPLARPFTSPSFPGFATPSASIQSIKPRKGVPASHSRNGLRDSVNWTGPPPSFPPSMLDNTSDWVAEQAQAQATTAPIISIPTPVGIPPKDSAQQPSIPPLTPLIPPIRAFRATRRSAEIRASPVQRSSMDHKGSEDETLRALEAFDRVGPQRSSNREQEEQNSDDSDLFLKLAREEAPVNNPLGRGPIRRVCTSAIKSFKRIMNWILAHVSSGEKDSTDFSSFSLRLIVNLYHPRAQPSSPRHLVVEVQIKRAHQDHVPHMSQESCPKP